MRSVKISIILLLEGAAFIGALALLGIILLAGRLMMGPLTITELTPVFENMLSQPDSGVQANISQSALTWDKERRKAVLNLNNIQFVDKLQQSIATIPEILLVLSPMGYLDETHSPWHVIVRGPQMHMRVDTGGKLHLGALDSGAASDAEINQQKQPQEELTYESTKILLQDILRSPHTRSAGLGLFANVKIENGGLTLIDEGKQVTWNAVVPELSLKRIKNDYAGMARLNIKKSDMETAVDFTLGYKAATKTFTATGSFDHLNPSLLASSIAQMKSFDFISSPLTGSMTVALDEDMTVVDGGLNVNLDKGEIKIPDLYAAPLPFKAGQLVARYYAKDSKLRMEKLRFDMEKMVLQGEAEIEVGKTPRDVKATFKVTDLPVENLPDYWPEHAGKNARDWILENIHKGKLDEVVLKLGLTVPENDVTVASLSGLDGTIKISDAQMTCWKPLPDLHHVRAEGTFTQKGFDFQILSAEQGDIKFKPSHVVITGLDEIDQIIAIDAHMVGPAPALLAVLDRDPLGYARKMNIKPKDTSGNVDGHLHMSFPLLKDLDFDRIELKADAKISEAAIKNVAGLVDVSEGEITLDLDKAGLAFKGDAKLGGASAHVDWKERFAAANPEDPLSHAVIKAKISGDDIKKFGLDVAIHTDGAFPVELTYDRSALTSKLHVTADAKDVALQISDLFYSKPAGAEFNLLTTLDWGAGKSMQLSQLKVTGKDVLIEGKGSFDASQHLSKLTINPLRLGATQASVDFIRSKDGVPEITIKGDVLDIRQAFDNKKPETKTTENAPSPTSPTPLQIRMDIARVLTGEKTELNNLRANVVRDAIGFSTLELNVTAKNKTPFTFSLRPVGDRTVLVAATPNLANILSSLNVTDAMIGGKLAIDGKSEAGDRLRNIFGHIKLENYRVKDMPVLAQLISAISPDGLAAMLGGEGLGFSELNGEYTWTREGIVINKAHTSSGSLGLTVAGKIDLQRSAIELEGQVIPVVFISRILSSIPIIGDILTGGEGQGLFAATYRVEGPISSAKVSVNPVSVLAPGILRNILFMDKDITRQKEY